VIPCVIFEDEHLLAVNKPAGINTHAPAPHAGEGLYDWLRNREPRWASLAIIHRLDKETSGVMVFAKTPLANRSLTDQFARRQARKRYVFLTRNRRPTQNFTARNFIRRAGEKYLSAPQAPGDLAETVFAPVENLAEIGPATIPPGLQAWWAEPRTGRTHQIRVHAAEHGLAIAGDPLYGDTSAPAIPRLCLHAAELRLTHPATKEPLCFSVPPDFAGDPRQALRSALIDPAETNAFRTIHGASDGCPAVYVDRLGDFLLAQSEQPIRLELATRLARDGATRGWYEKTLLRRVRQTSVEKTCPRHAGGEPAPETFVIRENALQFELSFNEGYSVGLFLDQRDNRRRLLNGWVGPAFPPLNLAGKRVLNTFAYTCGFSVCAAKTGAATVSLDLSRKYLDWGKRNFALNELPATGHEFIFGDVFDWLRRFHKRQQLFDMVLLDPPTFSQSRETGVFQAKRDYGILLEAALSVLQPGGVVFASNNTADWQPSQFLEMLRGACDAAKRRLAQEHYVPQPPDFPMSKAEPGYLKTVWLRLAN